MALTIFLVSLVALSLIGTPMGFAIGFIAIIFMYFLGMPDPLIIARRMITGIDIYTLMAIPFFMLAGEIMNSAGIVEDILNFSNALIGRRKGGLGHVNVLASMLFSGVSGSAVADTSALGSLEVPMMLRAGYDLPYSAAITAASAVIGPIIPPSIPMIILASISQISVAKLFIGGAIPGILIGISLMAYNHYISKKRNYPAGEKKTLKEFFILLRKTIWALIMPLIILGGIIGGVFTATEAGAIASIYGVIIAVFIYKLDVRKLKDVFLNAMMNTGIVLFICATAMVLTWYLAVAQVPQQLADIFLNVTSNKYVFIFLLNIMLFLLGMILDLTPALYLLAPILLPAARSFGMDTIHFGVVMVTNLCIGLITPPVGTVLYVTTSVSKVKMEKLIKELVPMYAVLFLVLMLISYLPFLVTYLPNLLG